MPPDPSGPDPFHTGSLRERVLATWTASPIRLREDANAEDDAARSAYQDRLVVELAQNAADAARRTGVPGRLHLHLAGDVLYAANPGAPLDAAGVEALSHRRVSTKGADDVGRYGVGFAAVLSVSDRPSVHASTGGVQWSRERAAELLATVPEVAAELGRRDGAVPVMRLPWPADDTDPVVRRLLDGGAATVVRLPLRDTSAVEKVTELLDGLDPLVLLFLGGLDELTVDGDVATRRVLARRDGGDVEIDDTGVTTSWRVRSTSGVLDADLLAERPTEERERPGWSVTWAGQVVEGRVVPYDGDRRLRAPQPLDDVVDVPLLLSASLPLDIGRRHVVASSVTDAVVGHAARAYADFLADLTAGPDVVDLLPGSLPAGPVDLGLRERLGELLPRTRFLGSAADADLRLRPDEAQVLDLGAASVVMTSLLAPHLPRLIDPSHVAGGRRQAALVSLGTRLLDTADVVDLLGAVDAPPAWWGDVVAALATAPDRDALRALPLPLADGSVVVGARDLLLPGDDDVDEAVEAAGLEVRRLHPDVARRPEAVELLRALGARDADPAAFLDDPRLRMLVESALDDGDDLVALADAVLSLVARVADSVERTWLAELPLPDTTGELRPAGELVLPAEHGGRLVGLVDPAGPLGVVDHDVVRRHGPDAVVAVGVLRTFATASEDDVVVVPDGLATYLDESEAWLPDLVAALPDGDGPWVLSHVEAVRDLELVRSDAAAWSAALAELGDVHLRVCTEPVVAVRDAARVLLPSYTSWWLRRHECVPDAEGRLHRPDRVAAADADPALLALYPSAASLPPAAETLLAQLGVLRHVGGLDRDQLAETLRRLAASGPSMTRRDVAAAYADLAARADVVGLPEVPEEVCALVAGALTAVPRADAAVMDAPDLAPLLGPVAVVPSRVTDAATVADLLDVELASEVVDGGVLSTADREARVDPTALPGSWDATPTSYAVHAPLHCADVGGTAVRVPWRVVGDALHVDAEDELGNLARALAWSARRWGDRHLVEALLRADAKDRASLLAESDLD